MGKLSLQRLLAHLIRFGKIVNFSVWHVRNRALNAFNKVASYTI